MKQPAAKWIALGFLACASGLLFWNLGEYALWDDEAGTALHATAVSQTGDTGAMVGENLVAFRNGVALQHLKDRTVSPLQYYVAAPFVAWGKQSSFFARLPFALAGFMVIGLVGYWAWTTCQTYKEMSIYFLVTLSTVPLFLYFRQCRYYSLVLLFEMLTLYFCCQKDRSLRSILAMIFSLWGLMASHYLGYFALIGALAVDYLFWGRKRNPFARQALVWIFVSQIGFATLLLIVWNPLATNWGSQVQEYALTPGQKLLLLLWNFRDSFRAEFLVFVPFALAPFVAAKKGDELLLRAFVAVVVIFLLTTLASPQTHLDSTGTADIRYVISVIPLGIFICGRVLLDVARGRNLWLVLGLLGFCFTNILNPFRLDRGQGLSAFVGFLRELIEPPKDPYWAGANWISLHAPERASIWVLPDYACYPLMFHAPHAIYAWQLRPEQKNEEQFKDLPDIHFRGVVPPDFIVVFGPSVVQIRQLIGQWSMQGLRYQEVARLMTFWKDLYRPELFWRSFKAIEKFDPSTEAIYIFQRQS